MMTPVSILKIVASASVFVAACSAALVFGLPHVQREDRVAADAVTAPMSAAKPAPAVRSDAPSAATQTLPAAHAATETPTKPAAPQVPIALAAAGPDPVAIAAELAGPPNAGGKNQSAPSFDIVRVEADGDAVIAGRAPPGATVDLMRGGERLDRAVADAAGEFTMVPPRLPAGSYELTLSAKLPDGTVASSNHSATVAINDAGPRAPAAQSRAEYVPQTAPQRLSSSEPSLRTAKAQESAGPSSNPGPSPRTARAISNKVISRGDSLWHISRITYGDGSRYALVYQANRDRIRDPNLIYPGQTLVLPAKRN